MEKPNISIEEKIKRIENTSSLDEVSLECLPPIQTDKYYFVSYSHKDYKYVYKDIFNLQQRGLSIWYDRGMEAGKSWKETAEKYITKHNCAGVILYLSENSLVSTAIHEEIKLLIENGKDFLTINLACDDKYTSAKEMIDILIKKGIKLCSEKIEFISKNLNKDVIYVKYNASYDEKEEKIKTLKSSPLFKIKQYDLLDYYEAINDIGYLDIWPFHLEGQPYYLETIAINDLEVKDIHPKDFYNSLNDYLTIDNFVRIGDSTFSNCRKLQNIILPERTSIIGNYAFYNCENLVNIDLSKIYVIKEHAFENCINLEKVDLTSIKNSNIISNYIFKNCKNLDTVILPKMLNEIGTRAFENTSIKSINLDYLYSEGIKSYAFYNCKMLETFEVKREGIFEISNNAFIGCEKFERFIVNKGQIKVGKKAFKGCKNLISFPFHLTNEIETEAFSECIGLTNLEINGCNIGNEAFSGCINITSINFKEFENYQIDTLAFNGLVNLESVFFAAKLNIIHDFAFKNCTNLKTVYIPACIEHIGESAFYNCKNLSEIYFDGTSEEFEELMYHDFIVPWFEETGEYKVICKNKVLSKYEFYNK